MEGLVKVAHREKDKKPFTPGAEVGQGAAYGAGLGGAFGTATGLVRDFGNLERLKEHGPTHAMKNQLVGFGLGAGAGALLQHHVNKKDEHEHDLAKLASVTELFKNKVDDAAKNFDDFHARYTDPSHLQRVADEKKNKKKLFGGAAAAAGTSGVGLAGYAAYNRKQEGAE